LTGRRLHSQGARPVGTYGDRRALRSKSACSKLSTNRFVSRKRLSAPLIKVLPLPSPLPGWFEAGRQGPFPQLLYGGFPLAEGLLPGSRLGHVVRSYLCACRAGQRYFDSYLEL